MDGHAPSIRDGNVPSLIYLGVLFDFAQKHDMHADPLKRVPLWILQSFKAALSRF
jgi:hypothetical protein